MSGQGRLQCIHTISILIYTYNKHTYIYIYTQTYNRICGACALTTITPPGGLNLESPGWLSLVCRSLPTQLSASEGLALRSGMFWTGRVRVEGFRLRDKAKARASSSRGKETVRQGLRNSLLKLWACLLASCFLAPPWGQQC